MQVYTQMQGHFGIWYDITSDKQYLDSIKRIAEPNLALTKNLINQLKQLKPTVFWLVLHT